MRPSAPSEINNSLQQPIGAADVPSGIAVSSTKDSTMPARSVALLLLCLAAVPLLAQARPSDDVPASAFSVEVPEAPKPQDPAPGNPEAARGERRIHLIGQAVRGPATDSFADSPAALPTVAFIVNADTSARPLIVMKLGTSASTFNVFDAADFPLLTVQSDGITKLARDQNTGTYLAISNANAGSAGATPLPGSGSRRDRRSRR
jgi:hypothetical protein